MDPDARSLNQRLDPVKGGRPSSWPDFRTIADFRKRHLGALGDLFTQVLALCARAGLVKLGHVALDGTKIKANASKHKAMSYARMVKAEAALAAEARAVAEAKTPAKHRGGRKPKTPPGEPKDGAQRNSTDPDSRIMKGKDGFIQAYNAQAAVDAEHQVILAQGLTDDAADQAELVPLLDRIDSALADQAKEVSTDVGYCSEANLAAHAASAAMPPHADIRPPRARPHTDTRTGS